MYADGLCRSNNNLILIKMFFPLSQVPVWAVWGMTLLAFILGVPMVKNITAFSAVTVSDLGLEGYGSEIKEFRF